MTSRAPDLDKCFKAAEMCACGNMRKATRAITQLYDEALRPSGLRATQLALLVAIRVRGPVTVKDLAQITVTDRTTLTRNLQPMEQKELIRIMPGEDRRERLVALTETGQKALAKALPLWQKAQGKVLKGLGQQRYGRLLSDLSAMVAVARLD